MSAPEITSFLGRVRARLNRGLMLRAASRCLAAGAAAAIVWALAWRAFGYAAPRWVYAIVILLAAVAVVLWVFLKRRETHDAAVVADGTFGLKDGLISWLDFRAREDREAFGLHEASMVRKVAGLDAGHIALEKPKRMFGVGTALALVAIVLGLLPHSEAVRKRLDLEAMTNERTAVVSKEMEEAVEELIKQLSKEERELIDENKLREWAKEIEQTKDAREAEKQMAKIEQQIALTMQGLEARQDEAMMKLAAAELEKSALSDLRQLGKNLDSKDFDKAAEQMKDMKPGGEKMTPEQLQKLRENAAKSKEMARRMADGAKKRDFGKMNNKDGKMGAMKPSDGKQRAMQDMLDKLDENARALDAELADGEFDDQDQEKVEMVDGEIDELANRLGKLGARAKAKDRLKALRQGLAGARSFSQGKCESAGLAQCQSPSGNPGGRNAGSGSSESRRNERDELADNGNRVEVKGQTNADGPSTNSVETAESGSGVSGRSGVAKEREFRQQFESMVRRDDIPESLKLGVREYFERVHETQGEEAK